jgi:hypothetical protein
MGLISILRRPMARACMKQRYACSCMGIVGVWAECNNPRSVKKRCACLVRAARVPRFSLPRGNGRAGRLRWVGSGGARMRGRRELDCARGWIAVFLFLQLSEAGDSAPGAYTEDLSRGICRYSYRPGVVSLRVAQLCTSLMTSVWFILREKDLNRSKGCKLQSGAPTDLALGDRSAPQYLLSDMRSTMYLSEAFLLLSNPGAVQGYGEKLS